MDPSACADGFGPLGIFCFSSGVHSEYS